MTRKRKESETRAALAGAMKPPVETVLPQVQNSGCQVKRWWLACAAVNGPAEAHGVDWQ